MITFNGDQTLKQNLIEQLEYHQKLDAFIQGEWLGEKIEGNGFKGCFYGCTMQTGEQPLFKFSDKYNIDIWFVYLTEKIFEGLPEDNAKTFPLEIIKALPVGLDIDKIKSEFFKELLKDQLKFTKKDSKEYKSIQRCIQIFFTPFSKITESAALEAALEVRSAGSATATATEWSARSAEWSARSAGSATATAAARSAARSVEWSAAAAYAVTGLNYYIFLKDLLIKILNNNE